MNLPKKHGIETRYSQGRHLRLLSYAIWSHGVEIVSHKTTRANFRQGMNLMARLLIERERNPELPLI